MFGTSGSGVAETGWMVIRDVEVKTIAVLSPAVVDGLNERAGVESGVSI